MLVSKNPYVVAARVNLAPKKPNFALKTGENFTQNSRLKSLIFIVENYGKKLLFDFISKNTTTLQIEYCCLGTIGKSRYIFKLPVLTIDLKYLFLILCCRFTYKLMVSILTGQCLLLLNSLLITSVVNSCLHFWQ